MSDLPRMPEGDAGSEPPGTDTLIRFHLTGEGADADPHGLRPALTGALLGPDRRWQSYPLVLLDPEASGGGAAPVVPLSTLIADAIDRLSAGGDPPLVLSKQIPRLTRAVERVLNHGGAGAPLVEVLGAARERFVGEFDLSEAGAAALRHEIDRLEAVLPSAGTVLVPGWRSLLELYVSAIAREREAARAKFVDEVRGLVLRLSELLQIDTSHGPEGSSPQALSSNLGAVGDNLFDTAALARLLPARRGPTRLAAARRARVEQARSTLLHYLQQSDAEPRVLIVHVDEWPGDVSLEGVEDLRSSESLEQAAAEFDARAGRMAEVLRAARVARLELDGAYEPERHDRALDRFDWRTARREELRLFPQVAVLEHAEGVRRKGMGALFDLLLSGRPVHALLLERPLLQRAEELARPHLDLGYLAAAQHVAFVLQSTLAQPEHVDAGFAAMARTPLPAVALVAAPTGEGETPAPVELAVAHEARATPCFRYDPESGESWADCFELGPNPQTERIWPVHELRYADEAGSEATREESFTYAHAAAMDSSFGCHFRCLAPAEWDDSQIEIAEYLALDEAGRSHKLPFVWTVDEDRRLTRTVLTHELAETCRDRMNRWRTFRELAGVESRHALRAAEQARLDAEARAEEAAREAATKHEEELERVRETAGQEALERLVNVLMDLESAPGSAPALTSERAAALVAEAATAPGAETAEVPAVSEEAPPEQPAEEEEGLSFDEPYIDSVLCTTCNECINLNSRLFTYNENKQATIGDPSAGTFDELVKAAEKCPARCIHPGKPRDDDPTVTDALRARAAKFD